MTVEESRIIAEYAEAHNLIPQLSNPSIGQYHFTVRGSDKHVTVTMLAMKTEVKAARAEAKQSKRRRQA